MKCLLWFCPALGPWFMLCIGGSSSSTQATENTTNQTDMRATGGDQATVISASDSTVNVRPTDFGAVLAGQDTARAALQSNADIASASVKAVKDAATGNAAETGSNANNQTLIAMGALGLVAVMSVLARKG